MQIRRLQIAPLDQLQHTDICWTRLELEVSTAAELPLERMEVISETPNVH